MMQRGISVLTFALGALLLPLFASAYAAGPESVAAAPHGLTGDCPVGIYQLRDGSKLDVGQIRSCPEPAL